MLEERELQRSHRILPEAEDLISAIVHDKSVIDFGTWLLDTSEHLILLGAEEVLAIDKQSCAYQWLHMQVKFKQIYFQDFPLRKLAAYDVGFVSWPNAYNVKGLTECLAELPIVIYVGSNVQGSMCGSDDLWDHFCSREVLAYLPHLSNTTIIYGGILEEPRCGGQLYHEEFVTIDRTRIYNYSDYAYPMATRDLDLWDPSQI